MSIVFNETTVTQIQMDGTTLQAVIYNGVPVFGSCAIFETSSAFMNDVMTIFGSGSVSSFQRAPIADKPASAVEVHAATSPLPIYAWKKTGTNIMCWASAADIAFLNPESSGMFLGSDEFSVLPFYGASQIDFSGIYADLVENAAAMFYGCHSLAQLNLGHWNTGRLAYADEMFSGCTQLTTIYATDGLSLPSDATDMFVGCNHIVGGNGTVYSAGHVGADYARIDREGSPGYFTAAS